MTGTETTSGADATIHVAQFLQEPVGATRQRTLEPAALPLDAELTARDVRVEVRLTRIPAGILADGQVAAMVTLECMRCLEPFAYPVAADFADQYRPTVDIHTGVDLAPEANNPEEAEYFAISPEHLIDLDESLRQAILLALPMAPHCREDCPGLAGELAGEGEEGDDRFAALRQLLHEAGDDAERDAGELVEGRGAARRNAS